MKITDLKTFVVESSSRNYRNYVFVKVSTDQHIYGWGEATIEGKERTVVQAIADLADYLVGKDPFRIEEHWYRMYRHAFWTGGALLNTAISGVEQALWDIKSKALGVPVYELIGGQMRERIRVYANGWFLGCRTPKEFARAAARTVKEGFDALKWDPFGTSGLFISPEQARLAVKCVEEVRSAVGPDVELLVEVHGRLSPANAIRIGNEMAEYRPYCFEEPVPPENVDAMALVARSIPIPVATGERLYTKWGFKDVLEKQAAAIIQPDPCHAGGILELKKIAAMAEVHYVGLAPHNSTGPVCTAVCLHIDASTPNFAIQELHVGDWERIQSIQKGEFILKDGCVDVPKLPGLGIDLDEKELAKYPFQPHDMAGMFDPAGDLQPD